tara:strand:+ start:801 stop:1727 length:927 start_codon:yes stop_codon:yes gene_type:complete
VNRKKTNNYSSFISKGWYDFGNILDKKKCKELYDNILRKRPLTKNIFYQSKKEFKQKGRFKNYSPGASNHNFLLDQNIDLSFIEDSKLFKDNVGKIMGNNYKIMKKTVIRSVPFSRLPKWIVKETEDFGRPNLNPFITDKFQDIQYFLNADFHQDMTRGKKFATFYIYLENVKRKDSALRLLENSHIHGATPYPHYLRTSKREKDMWFYTSLTGEHLKCREICLEGTAGKVACWHGLTLHGSYYNFSNNPRVSLRYLIQSNSKHLKNSIFGKCRKNIKGKMVEKNSKLARLDRNKDGSFVKTGMLIGP